MSKIDDLNTLVRLLKEYELPVSPILEFAIKEKIEAFSGQKKASEMSIAVPVGISKPKATKVEVIRKKNNPSTIRVVRDDGSFIQCSTAAETICETIKEIGAKMVYELKIPMDGMNLVTIGGNPLYPTAQHDIGENYYVNVHSNTATKKRQLEKIFWLLNKSWRVEVIE